MKDSQYVRGVHQERVEKARVFRCRSSYGSMRCDRTAGHEGAHVSWFSGWKWTRKAARRV